jgi:hypothetical protein
VVATLVVAVLDGYRVFFLVEVVLCLVGAAWSRWCCAWSARRSSRARPATGGHERGAAG